MATDYLSYTEILDVAGRKERCCECNSPIQKKETMWLLVVTEQGVKPCVFKTCDACHSQRLEFCTEHFTPTELMRDLEALRSALSYDSVRPWAMLTNAISLLRQRRAGAGPVPKRPALSPTPLRGVRVIQGGFLP